MAASGHPVWAWSANSCNPAGASAPLPAGASDGPPRPYDRRRSRLLALRLQPARPISRPPRASPRRTHHSLAPPPFTALHSLSFHSIPFPDLTPPFLLLLVLLLLPSLDLAPALVASAPGITRVSPTQQLWSVALYCVTSSQSGDCFSPMIT